jgi:hypothetical protein
MLGVQMKPDDATTRTGLFIGPRRSQTLVGQSWTDESSTVGKGGAGRGGADRGLGEEGGNSQKSMSKESNQLNGETRSP